MKSADTPGGKKGDLRRGLGREGSRGREGGYYHLPLPLEEKNIKPVDEGRPNGKIEHTGFFQNKDQH